jgi:hypothetical protein
MPTVEALESAILKSVARPATRPGIPRRHHHLAYSTHDTRATIDTTSNIFHGNIKEKRLALPA